MHSHINGIQLRAEYRNFLQQRITEVGLCQAASINLTLKQTLRRDNGTWQKLSRTEVSRCVRHLLDKLNRKVYGAAYRRYRKRLRVITAIEGGSGKHLHVHLWIEIPAHFHDRKATLFESIVIEWRRLRWADKEHKIREASDPMGWIDYITKDMATNDEVIDIFNTHL